MEGLVEGIELTLVADRLVADCPLKLLPGGAVEEGSHAVSIAGVAAATTCWMLLRYG